MHDPRPDAHEASAAVADQPRSPDVAHHAALQIARTIAERPAPRTEGWQLTENASLRYSTTALLNASYFKALNSDIDSWHDLTLYLRRHRDISDVLSIDDIPNHDTIRRFWEDRASHRRGVLRRDLAALERELRNLGVPPIENILPDVPAEEKDDRISEAERQQTVQQAQEHIYDVLGFDRAYNASIPERDLLDAAAYISAENDFAEDGVTKFTQRSNTAERAFSPETFRMHLRDQDLAEIHEQLKAGVEKLLRKAQAKGWFTRGVTLALDFTETPYWNQGDADAAEGVIKTHKINSKYAYRWLTISAVDQGKTLKLASIPIQSKKSTNRITISAIRRANDLVNIDKVLADAEFGNRKILRYMDHEGIDYIFRARMTKKVQRMIKANADGHSYITDYTMTSGGNRKYQTTLVAVTKDERGQWYSTEDDEDSGTEQATLGDFDGDVSVTIDTDEWVSFATNIAVDEENARGFVNEYRRRWAIETQYRVLKDAFLARTASRSFELRQYLWMLACLLYNVWMLLRILIEEIAGPDAADDETPTASSFGTRLWDDAYG